MPLISDDGGITGQLRAPFDTPSPGKRHRDQGSLVRLEAKAKQNREALSGPAV
jgi:hypothetical protein